MAAAKPTPAAIRRGIQALEAAGKPVGALRIMRDGSVLILATAGIADISSDPPSGEDEWDKATGVGS